MEFEEWWEQLGLDCEEEGFSVHDVGADYIARAAWKAAWQAAQPKWRPIETIPTDGRRVLVYRPLAHKTGDEQIAVKHAQGGTNGFCWPQTVPGGATPTNPTDGSCHATYWMPMPELPHE